MAKNGDISRVEERKICESNSEDGNNIACAVEQEGAGDAKDLLYDENETTSNVKESILKGNGV